MDRAVQEAPTGEWKEECLVQMGKCDFGAAITTFQSHWAKVMSHELSGVLGSGDEMRRVESGVGEIGTALDNVKTAIVESEGKTPVRGVPVIPAR